MKTNLKDISFLIPIRIDTVIRMENLLISINYLIKNFDTTIMVLEAADYSNGLLNKLLNKRVQYMFVEDKDPVFYRTKYLNIMTNMSTTQFVAIWDADVIIPKVQIIDSIKKLREGFEIAYPYDGHFYDTSDIIRELFIRNKKIQTLLRNSNKMDLTYGDKMIGGAIFVNKEAYILAGMENERFYGWGPEDADRYWRWLAFGYKIHYSTGSLFHLAHPRGINSSFRSDDQKINTNLELFRTIYSSKEEIIFFMDCNKS